MIKPANLPQSQSRVHWPTGSLSPFLLSAVCPVGTDWNWLTETKHKDEPNNNSLLKLPTCTFVFPLNCCHTSASCSSITQLRAPARRLLSGTGSLCLYCCVTAQFHSKNMKFRRDFTFLALLFTTRYSVLSIKPNTTCRDVPENVPFLVTRREEVRPGCFLSQVSRQFVLNVIQRSVVVFFSRQSWEKNC